jgi:hypothetical protein
MAATPTSRKSGSSESKRRGDEIDDTVPAREEKAGPGPTYAADSEPPVRPTIPLDRYRLGNELGRGGMGRVVEAFDTQLGRTVALKEVLTKGTHRRFAREIHITARLEHASIVPLYDSGINMDGKPYYVMRKVSGKPLDEMVARCKDLDERLTLLPRLLSAIEAVAHAHSRGVIHRDIKPQNILLAELGETVVIDWGLAKVVGEEEEANTDTHEPSAGDSLQTQIGSVFGTPGFMAPEQARGEALDTQGDVYALGATLYQLLSGEPPVRGVSATEVMDKTRTHDIRPLAETAAGAPPELVAIATKALAFDPNNRYRDAGELGEDVRRFLDGRLVAAHDYTKRQKLARFARRYRGVLSVIAIAAVAVAVMAWIGVHRIITERDAATDARKQADEGRKEALDARDRLVERNDALIVMQARTMLETNPTEAIAILKQLPAQSPRLDEARGIASRGGGARRDLRDADHHRARAPGGDVRRRPLPAPGLARRHGARVRSRSPSPDRVALVRPAVARRVGRRRQVAGDQSQGAVGDLRSEGRHRRAARVARDRHRLPDGRGRSLPSRSSPMAARRCSTSRPGR